MNPVRLLLFAAIAAVLLGPVAAAPAQGPASFAGAGAARALDMSIPALNIHPELAKTFKGLTVGATFAEFTQSAVNGFAAGQCELLHKREDAAGLCAEGTFEASSSSGNPGTLDPTCRDTLAVAVVKVESSCGNSVSKVDSGRPWGANEAKVASALVSLDLEDLGLGSLPEDAKDQLIRGLTASLNAVFDLSGESLDELQGAVDEFFTGLSGSAEAVRVKMGPSTTDVTSAEDSVKVTSRAAGGAVGLLGIADPLTDGLIIVEVSAAEASATFNRVAGSASSSAKAAVATVKVRDLLGICESLPSGSGIRCTGGHAVAAIKPSGINTLLAPLNGTVLETTVELATATGPMSGKSVRASSTGVGIRALKGLGASGEGLQGRRDGGVTLRLAAADVTISGVLGRVVEPPLPVTGGRSIYWWLGAVVLGALGVALVRLARRVNAAG